MAYPIEKKLVIGVASSALFDLSESDAIFRAQGVEEYRRHQEANLDQPLPKGVAFPFIRRFLGINAAFPKELPVEVVLLSRNSPETGLRVFRFRHYGLDITRAGFMAGHAPYEYIPAFNASLFLSAHEDDVRQAVAAGYPAGAVLPSQVPDDETDGQLRVAFDFDGVIADDEAEAIFKKNHDLDEFEAYETSKRAIPHRPGPLADLFQKLSALQQLEQQRLLREPGHRKILRISIVTARNAPNHERVVTTLKSWGVEADEAFFLGGMEKSRILSVLRPHMFFDDQRSHLRSPGDDIPMVHVPFGVANPVA
ncbi:MAG: 5'-nucleotidase [Candidatus Dactylopiibacterium carminicum]|uniref:5'-nucleotidase n=1 Tax=Candidatus Dactylopiibacterium carminicum TaxID=857335 RepID=A0A272EYR6_9RHOO|nr:5'-nucleotidase [Candidatus Dactylopiibacterium carminicum]KAF7600588.1 5'-nucleotidase [Candidatus Dactylopiibacterium carminicum]PAS95176.1 MAG: 5'-nucleotidase [Candidatus Dactylopiibacterium carminicum]PAT00593.1 MAG: 5'-nucleotidase [Candidatus Dactylopiibacterium carminicum]